MGSDKMVGPLGLQAYKLYMRGMTRAEASREVGCDPSTLVNYIRRHKLPNRDDDSFGKPKCERRVKGKGEQVYEEHLRTGEHVLDICKREGIDPQLVYSYMAYHKLKRRPTQKPKKVQLEAVYRDDMTHADLVALGFSTTAIMKFLIKRNKKPTRMAYEYRLEHGCSYAEAGLKFGVTASALRTYTYRELQKKTGDD